MFGWCGAHSGTYNHNGNIGSKFFRFKVNNHGDYFIFEWCAVYAVDYGHSQ